MAERLGTGLQNRLLRFESGRDLQRKSLHEPLRDFFDLKKQDMLIGEDFEKLRIELFGYTIIEPNALITDTLMAAVSLFFAYSLFKKNPQTPFLSKWYYFFLIFGISSFSGGLGHSFYLYWGVAGKFFNWISGILAIYILEQAMLMLLKKDSKYKTYQNLLHLKLFLTIIAFTAVCITQPIQLKPQLAFIPIALNTFIGVIVTVGILGYRFSRTRDVNYKYFYYGVLIMLPSAVFFFFKINLQPWFDKNDFSHVLFALGIGFFYWGIIQTNQKRLA